MAKTYTEVRQFPSSSSSSVYTVKKDETGALSCDCPAWKFKKGDQPRSCKHTDEVLAGQLTPKPEPVKPPTYRPLSEALAELSAEEAPAAEEPEPQAEAEPEAASPDLPDIAAMMAEKADGPFDSADHIFEPKLDGARFIAYVRDGSVRLLARSAADHTDGFPDLQDIHLQVNEQEAVLDCEVVCFDGDGKVDFAAIQSRMHSQKALAVKLAAQQNPATLMVFDVLRMNGVDLTAAGERVPLIERKKLLAQLVESNGSIRIVDFVEGDGVVFFEACQEAGMEGAMAKTRDGLYQPGKRDGSWLKVKGIHEDSFIVGGLTEGTGWREDYFGALLVGRPGPAGLEYVGSVGTGFDNRTLIEAMQAIIEAGLTDECPFTKVPAEPKLEAYVNPTIVVDVQYQEITPDWKLRFPSFQRLRPDVAAQDVGK